MDRSQSEAGMIVRIDPDSPIPAFEQLRQQIERMIASGVLAASSRLPTIRQLAKDLDLAPGTVARAYQELERVGAIATRGRHGTFVNELATEPTTIDLDQQAEDLAVKAHQLVGGEVMLPIHWATFNLALHGWTEPGERVLAEARRTGARVVTPLPGERFLTDDPPEPKRWWPALPWRTAHLAPVVSSLPAPVGS